MAVKVPGSLAGLQIVNETTYGVTPTTAFTYFGHMRTLEMTHDPHSEELEPDNSRTFSDVIFTAEDFGFSTELSIFRTSAPYNWSKILESTIGQLSGIQDDIPSFSSVLQVAKDQFFIAKGCKINSIELNAGKVGSQIYATLEIMSMLIPAPSTSRAGLGTLGAAAAKPTTPPVTYSKYPTCNIPGITIIPASSWKLKIDNKLERKEGLVNGKALTAGTGIIPGDAIDIHLSMEVLSTSKFWDALKIDLTKGFNVSVFAGGYAIQLLDCYLPSNDMPSRSHKPYDETINIKAKNISVIADP